MKKVIIHNIIDLLDIQSNNLLNYEYFLFKQYCKEEHHFPLCSLFTLFFLIVSLKQAFSVKLL